MVAGVSPGPLADVTGEGRRQRRSPLAVAETNPYQQTELRRLRQRWRHHLPLRRSRNTTSLRPSVVTISQ